MAVAKIVFAYVSTYQPIIERIAVQSVRLITALVMNSKKLVMTINVGSELAFLH
jgi:hypothetical protein